MCLKSRRDCTHPGLDHAKRTILSLTIPVPPLSSQRPALCHWPPEEVASGIRGIMFVNQLRCLFRLFLSRLRSGSQPDPHTIGVTRHLEPSSEEEGSGGKGEACSHLE